MKNCSKKKQMKEGNLHNGFYLFTQHYLSHKFETAFWFITSFSWYDMPPRDNWSSEVVTMSIVPNSVPSSKIAAFFWRHWTPATNGEIGITEIMLIRFNIVFVALEIFCFGIFHRLALHELSLFRVMSWYGMMARGMRFSAPRLITRSYDLNIYGMQACS